MSSHLGLVPTSADASGVTAIVESLAALRTQAQRRRYPGDTPQLPSRQSIHSMADDFLSVLYPRQFGESVSHKIDGYVATTLKRALLVLEREIQIESLLAEPGVRDASAPRRDPASIAAEFVQGLPRIRERGDLDIRASLDAEPAQGSFDELVFCSPGVAATLRHRLAHELFRLRVPLLAKIIAEDSRSKTGIDIHPGAEIGEGFSIGNGAGSNIGETAIIGRNVRIHQGVTLGEGFSIEIGGASADVEPKPVATHAASRDGGALQAQRTAATSDGRVRRHPLIEDDVVLHVGASLYGPIVVGKGSSIGRNVWLTQDVPAGIKIT